MSLEKNPPILEIPNFFFQDKWLLLWLLWLILWLVNNHLQVFNSLLEQIVASQSSMFSF